LVKALTKLNPTIKKNRWYKWMKRIFHCSPIIVLIILSIVLYFSQIIHLNFVSLNSWLAYSHIIFAIYLWINTTFNYFAAIVVKPGRPPKKDELLSDLNENFENLSPETVQGLEFCNQCNRLQTYGTQHCQKCGDCIRMLCHHSSITNNCIGLTNFAYYFSFLVYGFFGMLYSFYMTYGPFHACYVHDHQISKVSLEYPALSQQICTQIGELPLVFVVVSVALVLQGGLLFLHCILLAADLSFLTFKKRLRESKSYFLSFKTIIKKSFQKHRRIKFNMLIKGRKESWKQFLYPSFNVLPYDLCLDDLFDEDQCYVQMV